jgi:hypothetical protein
MSEQENASGAQVPCISLLELLPCPFCGSPAKTYCGTVTCSNKACKMHFGLVPNMHTPQEWNTRISNKEVDRDE